MTNPLRRQPDTSRAPGTAFVNGEHIPTDIVGYCAWLNSKERRNGTWRVVDDGNGRTVTFVVEQGSADWLAERGFAPKIGKAA